MHPGLLLARLLLVRKCPRLLRLLVPFARHLLVLVLLVLPSRLRLIALSVVSSVRAASSRFAAVACSSTRRVVPLLRLPPLVLPPLLRLVPRGSLRWRRRGLHSLRRRRLRFHSLSLLSPLRFSRHPRSSR